MKAKYTYNALMNLISEHIQKTLINEGETIPDNGLDLMLEFADCVLVDKEQLQKAVDSGITEAGRIYTQDEIDSMLAQTWEQAINSVKEQPMITEVKRDSTGMIVSLETK